MSAAPPLLPPLALPAPAKARSPWNTPRRMRLGVTLVVLAGVVFLLQALTMVARSRSALHVVQKDTAPSIIAAQSIRAWLADLDANAANELLGNSWQRDAAHKVFEDRRVQVTGALVAAAENITFGDAERLPIVQMVEHLGHFLELATEARVALDMGNPALAVTKYHAAHEEMQVELGAAAELDRVNRSQLDQAYQLQRGYEATGHTLALITGALLLAALLWLQVFLMHRTRRILNVPLVFATLVSLGSIVMVMHDFSTAEGDLQQAKEDAFDSIHVLWQARALAYDANGDESRFLLDVPKPGADVDTQMFRDRVATLTGDLFPREIRNVTYEGESTAAKSMSDLYAAYLAVDTQIRALEKSGKHDAAVELCIGPLATESNAKFARFDQALEATLAINMRAFTAQTDDSDKALYRLVYILPFLTLLIVAAALVGIRPRLREYAV